MKKTLFCSIVVSFFCFSAVNAQDIDECAIKIKDSLVNSFERKVYDYYPELLRSFVVCDQFFSDRLMGMLHEGVHFLDLDYRETEKKLALIEKGELTFTENMFLVMF